MNHYLITIPAIGDRFFHGYLMTDDKDDIDRATSKIFDTVGDQIQLPIILITPLQEDGRKLVINTFGKVIEDKHKFHSLVKAAKNFHFTVIDMHSKHLYNDSLMKLH